MAPIRFLCFMTISLLTVAAALSQERIGTQRLPLVTAGAKLWTEHDRHIPMCWHELINFPDTEERNAAKDFVLQTVQESWVNLLNLRATWEDCPTSGDAKHVRVKLRQGDSSWNGTTVEMGVATLSTAADRRRPEPNDPPGLLMGFPSNWNQDASTRTAFAGLIRHEFGHILGFTHEDTRDGPASAGCYRNVMPNGYKIGPPDPASIMGYGYCTTAGQTLTPNDLAGARSLYGIGHTFERMAAHDGRFPDGFTTPPGGPIALARQKDGAMIVAVTGHDGVPYFSWQVADGSWHAFERIAAPDSRFPDGFTVPPGAPISLAMQHGDQLVAAVVGRDGVPYISWQRPGTSWNRFERIAAYDNRFPDGFTVPPGAPITLARARSGDVVAVVVGRDGVPYIAWQQRGAPWHRFERIAAPDRRFSDGFTVPPGALVAVALQQNGALVATVVGRDGVPYIAWEQPGAAWHVFERIAPIDSRFSDGFTVPPGSPMSLAMQSGGTMVTAVVGRDGVPYISWQQPNAPWHRFERIAAHDSRFPDGFTVPAGAPIFLAPHSDGILHAAVVGHDGRPYVSWQRRDAPWSNFERIAPADHRFPDYFTVPPGARVAMALAARPSSDIHGVVVGRDGVPYVVRVSGFPPR